MAPRPQALRPEFTAEVLRDIAGRCLNVRSKGKYSLLADIVDGKVRVEDLPAQKQLTVQRYIREANSASQPEVLANPPRHGPPVVVRTDTSAEELRRLAQAAGNPNHQAIYLTIATLIETNDVATASENGFSHQHVLKLARLFNALGIERLISREISGDGIEILRKMLEESEPDDRNHIEALLVFATERLTTTAVRKRFGIPEGTFNGYVEQFLLHGADAFKSRSERKARRTTNDAAAEQLEVMSKSSRDPVTRKRTGAVAACLRGEGQFRVEKKYGVTTQVLTKWIRESGASPFALFGEGAFKRPIGGRVVSELQALSAQQSNPAYRSLMDAATAFYSGQRFKKITDRFGVDRLDLYALLWDIQANHFEQIATTVEKHFQRPDNQH